MRIFLAVFLLVFFSSKNVFAAKKNDEKGVFNISFENDFFAGTDGGYTNGIRLSYITPEEDFPELLHPMADHLSLLNHNSKRRVSYAVGQSIFTPADITDPNPIPNDRPYAGWLYASLGIVSYTDKLLDNLVLTIGTVGPSSQAEATQKGVHDLLHRKEPQGWDYQLNDEPGAIVTYERKWREIFQVSRNGVGFDAMPHVGANVGNIFTDAAIGTTFRFGYDLPADFGPPRIRPSLPGSDFFVPTQKLSGYLFAAFEGRYVLRNIFLDGNTFSNSQHVDKKKIVGSMQLGASMTYHDMRISYTHIFVTKEFKGQPGDESRFGSVNISWRF